MVSGPDGSAQTRPRDMPPLIPIILVVEFCVLRTLSNQLRLLWRPDPSSLRYKSISDCLRILISVVSDTNPFWFPIAVIKLAKLVLEGYKPTTVVNGCYDNQLGLRLGLLRRLRRAWILVLKASKTYCWGKSKVAMIRSNCATWL